MLKRKNLWKKKNAKHNFLSVFFFFFVDWKQKQVNDEKMFKYEEEKDYKEVYEKKAVQRMLYMKNYHAYFTRLSTDLTFNDKDNDILSSL